MSEAKDSRWRDWALIALAMVPCVVVIWSVDYIPMLDGPKHAYAAHVRANLSEPWYSAHFSATRPLTAFGFGVVYAALEKVLPWRDALRVALSLIVIGWCAATAGLARALHARRWPLAVAASGAAIQWALLMGFLNYVCSAAIGIGAMAVGLARAEWSVRRELSVAALLVVGCAFHPFGPQCAGVVLGVALLLSTPARLWIRRLGALFLMLTPAVAITLVTHEQIRESRFEVAISGGPRSYVPPLLERLENFGTCFAGGPAWRAWPLVLLAVVGACWAAVLLVRRRHLRSAELPLVVFVVLTTALALSLPFHGDAWQFFSPRFIPLAVIGGLMLLPIEQLGRRAFASIVAFAWLFNVATNAWQTHALRDLRTRSAEALAALDRHAIPGHTLLPIVFDWTATNEPLRERRSLQPPYVEPLLNLGDIYALDRRAVSAYSFSSSALPALFLIEQRKTFPRVPSHDYYHLFATGLDDKTRAYELARLGSYGARFDDIVFYGAERDADFLIAAGYEVEFRKGRLMIAHFRGCPAVLRIEGGPDSGTLFVATGWGPYDRQTWDTTLPSRSRAEVALPGLPCGDAWVRVSPSDSRAACEGADDNGIVRVRLPREDGIRCALRPQRPPRETK